MLNSRINIIDIKPQIQNGKYFAKATINEPVKITAKVFFENINDILSVKAVINGNKYNMKLNVPGRDLYKVKVPIKTAGYYEFHIEASITHYKKTSKDSKSVIIKKYKKPLYKTVSKKFPIIVERKTAVYGAWYELFIRNYGA